MENNNEINRYERRITVYTAYSKYYFFAKMLISAYVLNEGYIPLNPFNNWAYFMDDMVDRELVARGNNNLIMLADEVWTFGPIADGVFREVKLANSLGKPVRHFSIGKKLTDIKVLENKEIEFEEELLNEFDISVIKKEFKLSDYE